MYCYTRPPTTRVATSGASRDYHSTTSGCVIRGASNGGRCALELGPGGGSGPGGSDNWSVSWLRRWRCTRTKRARVPWRGSARPIGITAIGQTERLSSGQPEMGSGSNFESTTRSRQQPRLRALGKRGIQISRSRGLGLPIALGRRTVGLGLAIPSSQRWEEGHDIE
jgi:hypothetical protein